MQTKSETQSDGRDESTFNTNNAVDEQNKDISVYMAGSIDNSEDYGSEWRETLSYNDTYEQNGITFLNPLDEHDPRDEDVDMLQVVPDDVALLEQCDGILLKYEHGKDCWGTPAEQGYALAKNIPVAVWWKNKDVDYSLTDTSVWLWHPRTSVGVYNSRDSAMSRLLWKIRGTRRKEEQQRVTTDVNGKQSMMGNDVLRDTIKVFMNNGGLETELNYKTVYDALDYETSKVRETLEWMCESGVAVQNNRRISVKILDSSESRLLINTLFQ